MGLDVNVYTKVKHIPNEVADEIEDWDFTTIQVIPRWNERCKSLLPDSYYEGEGVTHLSSGYSTHGLFRNELAMMLGYSDGEWKEIQNKEVPFYYLFDFADNEGCLDYEIASILYKNFVDHKALAEATIKAPFYVELYNKWLELLSQVSEGDVVSFH